MFVRLIEDEVVEEDMDDKEEQSEESKAVRVGQKEDDDAEWEEHERTHTFLIES